MKTKVLDGFDGAAQATAIDLLRKGGLVALPTETVYGLGANAFDAVAVARVFEAKRRPSFDPLIVHVGSRAALTSVVAEVPLTAEKLIDAFWPGPLTLVLPKADAVPGIVTSGLNTVAVRMPSHPVAQALLADVDAIAAPSANEFGQLSPTTAAHVQSALDGRIELILDGGSTEWGVESTIVDVTGRTPNVLRHGAVTLEQLRQAVGVVDDGTGTTATPKVPGQLPSHYAPHVPLHLVEDGDWSDVINNDAVLAFAETPRCDASRVAILSLARDLREAASTLFDKLHTLDASGANAIFAELVPDEGLGRAINDRLRRAASARRDE